MISEVVNKSSRRRLLLRDNWSIGLLHFGLRVGVGWQNFLLGLHDRHVVGKGSLGSALALGIPWQHNFDFDAKDTLTQEDVTAGCVDVVVARVTGVDHQPLYGSPEWIINPS